MLIDQSKFKNVHLVGIGGIGVSAIAKMMLRLGVKVTGSEITRSAITDELETKGVKIFYNHSADNVSEDLDLLIYSAAVPEDNPERQEARGRKTPEMSYFDFLGELSKHYFTIAVSGTNGKSTTTAMLGLILEAAGLDPTVIVGSKVKTFPDGNLRLGSGCVRPKHHGCFGREAGSDNLPILVVEACEYNAHMLKIQPRMIVLTNIEEDHLDYYQNLHHIKETFKQYIANLPAKGTLIYNSDDKNTDDLVNANFDKISNFSTKSGSASGGQFFPLRGITRRVTISKFSYGIDFPADYMAKNILAAPRTDTPTGETGAWVDSPRQYFDILRTNLHEEIIGNFSLQIPGKFNIYNALAATSAALSLGVLPETIRGTLANFSGIWRRFERVGVRGGAIIISDYGHHPTAIKETIRAARDFYPNRRIVLVYQPHQRNRTRKLFAEFVRALQTPDVLILSEIYDVTGREVEEDKNVSSKQLFDKIIENHKSAYFAQNLNEAEKITKEIIKPNDLVIVMGAGDIDKIARKLIR